MKEPDDFSQVVGQVGMALPDYEGRRARWAEAAPKMAMALSEAGYPTELVPWSLLTERENELEFKRFPPDDVLLKAAELTGVRDMVEECIDSGGISRGDGDLERDEWRTHRPTKGEL